MNQDTAPIEAARLIIQCMTAPLPCGPFKMLALSRDMATKFNPSVPWVCISITTTKGGNPRIDSESLVDRLDLAFPDCDRWTMGLYLSQGIEEKDLFNRDHAVRILDFIRRYERVVELVIVHCAAGVSRSAGVWAALTKLYGDDDTLIFANKRPNMLVYRTLLNTGYERFEVEDTNS